MKWHNHARSIMKKTASPEDLRTHLEWIENKQDWYCVKYDDYYSMFEASEWIDRHYQDLFGKYLIHANQIVFSDPRDATLFMLTQK